MNDPDAIKDLMSMGVGFAHREQIPSPMVVKEVNSAAVQMIVHNQETNEPGPGDGEGFPALVIQAEGLSREQFLATLLICDNKAVGTMLHSLLTMFLTTTNIEHIETVIKDMVKEQAGDREIPELFTNHGDIIFPDQDMAEAYYGPEEKEE